MRYCGNENWDLNVLKWHENNVLRKIQFIIFFHIFYLIMRYFICNLICSTAFHLCKFTSKMCCSFCFGKNI